MSDELFRLVLARYHSPEEVTKYRQRADSGLLRWEEVIRDGFFTSPSRLLDLGCGAGREAIALAGGGSEVTAVDISAELVEYALAAADAAGLSIAFEVIDGKSLPFPACSFDIALIWRQVLGNVPGASNRAALLGDVSRTMREDGILSLSVHNRDVCVPIAKEKGLILERTAYSLEDGDFVEKGESPSATSCYWHYFTRPELVRLVEEAGFQVLECDLASSYGQEGWDTLFVLTARKSSAPRDKPS